MLNYIIVGAGLAGSVLAERIANVLDKKVLLIEKRNHIGGNCFDYYNEEGILVHKYGPHIFHTNLQNVWGYMSQFTEWLSYQHHVLGFIDGKTVPIPFNLNTLHELLPKTIAEYMEKKLIIEYGFNTKIPILELKRSKDKHLKLLADLIYEKVFLNYTKKQWGVKPEELNPSVTERVPIYISKDNSYFQDKYQGTPRNGYFKIFEEMLKNSHIKLMLNTNFNEVIKIKDKKIYFLGNEFKGKLIFTGKIDELFDYKFGELPDNPLKFEFKTLDCNIFQKVGTVNYPNNYDFTRITEFKHLTGQKHEKTNIIKEYPESYEKEKNIPYYPIPKKEYDDIYQKYLEKANQINNLMLVGRLAEYKYYNMDSVIEKSLILFDKKLIFNGD